MVRYYRYTTCDLKRLGATSFSPVLCEFTDTVTGLSSIRAFRAEQFFIQKADESIVAFQRTQFSTLACRMWLMIRLQTIGIVLILAVALTAVIEHKLRNVDPALVGLALSYVLSITGLLDGFVQSLTETEKEMVSAERILHYVNQTPQEKWTGILSV
ncbi:unnamed protein product [Soboliphyme baturini]|uniref:ABC transmembrane type-1 domain-containing protein n=1 Tax=Soboliphyme baturini TaxID=241478 RepID=A0A183J1G3_9BILA|nr:unnamed protein product [Soboliphyme baturini]